MVGGRRRGERNKMEGKDKSKRKEERVGMREGWRKRKFK